MLRAVLKEKHPRMALGDIAYRFHVSLHDLQTVLNRHGYPEQRAMASAAARLEAEGAIAAPAPDDDSDAEAGGVLLKVRVGDLHTDPANVREELTDIDELADSIAEVGLLQPITARRHNGRLIVVMGHRRLAAVQKLRWTHVDTIVRADMRPDHVLAAMLIENGQRTDLDPIEEARALARLKAQLEEAAGPDRKVSDAEVGAKIGRNQVYVSGRLALLALTLEEQTAIRAGQMNIGDGVRRGRINSGNVRPTGSTGHPHLGIEHNLAAKARARCQRLAHKGKGRNSVGGVACGECWESVIRADERQHAHKISTQLGECVSCGQPVEKAKASA
jgi:ParB family chromosome partitioning protein